MLAQLLSVYGTKWPNHDPTCICGKGLWWCEVCPRGGPQPQTLKTPDLNDFNAWMEAKKHQSVIASLTERVISLYIVAIMADLWGVFLLSVEVCVVYFTPVYVSYEYKHFHFVLKCVYLNVFLSAQVFPSEHDVINWLLDIIIAF